MRTTLRSQTTDATGNLRSNPTTLTLGLILIAAGLLPISPLYVRAVIILLLGPLIFFAERRLGLPVPAAPGTMLWIGSTLSYVVGGLGTAAFFPEAGTDGLEYLDVGLMYLGLGLASYSVGIVLVGGFLGWGKTSTKELPSLQFTAVAITAIAAMFIIPVIISNATERGVFYNIFIGALASIEQLPMILLAFYLVQPRSSILLGIPLLAATFSLSWVDLTVGYGRSKLPLALIGFAATWLAIIWYSGGTISRVAKMTFVVAPVILLAYWGISTSYRDGVGLDREVQTDERLQALEESLSGLGQLDTVLASGAYGLFSRLVEQPSLELLGWVETGQVEHVGWNSSDMEQVLMAWVPKSFFLEKGEGYGRDIMEYYGLSPAWNNIPVTILTDALRRFGAIGVIGMYLVMGIASSSVARFLAPRWRALGLVLAVYFALLHLSLHSEDFLEVVNLYIYRFPSSAIVIYAILRLANMWQPAPKRTHQSADPL